ncbi:unnamed protein product [Acanthoscelides obtectus]|uniref:Uncharacterized protein n=1 Tax=Acanthoscelides obtectus TaxID=200917 RepID=A0A9P0LM56_ACAOB|nr:unnamed protein product [Acanthoscelides obtectus]CAK1654460.1 hypothetical protein AOBTE_LOCUS18615 [Acanthoscelides obtectus]
MNLSDRDDMELGKRRRILRKLLFVTVKILWQ